MGQCATGAVRASVPHTVSELSTHPAGTCSLTGLSPRALHAFTMMQLEWWRDTCVHSSAQKTLMGHRRVPGTVPGPGDTKVKGFFLPFGWSVPPEATSDIDLRKKAKSGEVTRGPAILPSIMQPPGKERDTHG